MGMGARKLACGEGWQIHDVTCSSGPRDRPFEERHNWMCIALVTAGTFQYRSAQGSAVMTPGSLMLGNIGTCFECGHEHSVGDRCLSFQFSPGFLEPIVAAVPGARRLEFCVPRLPPMPQLLATVAEAEALRDVAASRDAASAAELEELALRLVGSVCATLVGEPRACRAPSGRDARRVTTALRRIEAEACDRLSLPELAREAAMSPYHFLRTFEQVVGITPGQYMLRTRLRHAAVLLRSSPERVARIASEAGFGDLSTFNRQFRRAMGLSPGEYRARRGDFHR